nr:hypothetical protein Iba_scaffold1398069CG0020 [Ipomoea batatas]GMD89926.1 hypothetical protein Iba_chr14dCG4730 [Ipomoea batatas]GMD93589.1 hypothetical protein Iba_chr14fCG8900 [Ipomoea batatas]GME21772.1 hypothetical protein Iba_scaffold29167CG0010 [Ipomoea batatas]
MIHRTSQRQSVQADIIAYEHASLLPRLMVEVTPCLSLTTVQDVTTIKMKT